MRFLKDKSGMEMLEAAITTPIAILVMLAIVNMGMLIYAQQAVQAAEAPDDGSENSDSPPDEVQALIDQRAAARAGKDWAASDALRDQIAAAGWKVVDTKEGQRLEKMGS